MASQQRSGVREKADHPRLEPGTSGLAVMDMKRRLRKWYEVRGEPLPRRMRGPIYGTSAVEAVSGYSATSSDGIPTRSSSTSGKRSRVANRGRPSMTTVR